MKIAGGKLQVPGDFAGMYQIKVTPEATPWQKSSAASEYKVQTLVEVRSPGARGNAAVATPLNRVHYARGEEIPFVVHVRGAVPKDAELSVTLSDGSMPLANARVKFDPAVREIKLKLPGSLTEKLRPGKYVLSVAGKDLTGVSQTLVIGLARKGVEPFELLRVVYGDYGETFPQASAWDAPDLASACCERTARLGFNLMVDRLGHPLEMGAFSLARSQADVESFVKALEADPQAVAPAKLATLPTLQQILTGYGTRGISQMGILMGNDAGLPLGSGFDNRKPEQILKDLTTTTLALKDYPAFRGWSWSSNWWAFDKRGAAAGRTPEEKAAYQAALKRAKDTGAWDPVLDRVGDYRLSLAVDAQALFQKKLKELATGKTTAVACPFRNVESYPPVTLSNVDEVDLQAQWEQIGIPYHAPFNVDFYMRPGKGAWGHPEIWNDAGTGDQILTTLWQMIMRGPVGVGCSGTVPQWQFALKGNTDDPRLSWNGLASVYRSLNGVLKQYTLCLTGEKRDPVALIASGRMLKIDDWDGGVMGRHFARLMEASFSCLHAHRPARLIFTEDLGPDTLKQFQAVLLVGQTVEMEPALVAALKVARAAGLPVFVDGTCRAELVKDLRPLGISFDKLEKDPSQAGDDHAYWRLAGYAKANLPALTKALAAIKPAAQVGNPEVFIFESQTDQGRYLYVVNNTLPTDLEPGQLWRFTLGLTSLVPQVVPVKLDLKPGEVVYDVFARKQVNPVNGVVQADCRTGPARLYAILPHSIAKISVSGPQSVFPGSAFSWALNLQDAQGDSVRAFVPLRWRLMASNGEVLEEGYSDPLLNTLFKGCCNVPLNLPWGPLTFEVIELFSGKSARLQIRVIDSKIEPIDLVLPKIRLPQLTDPGQKITSGEVRDFTPAEESFGPHVRDLVVTNGGKLAVMNTMNWDHNLYGVDLETGKIQWRQRAGHTFAFEPVALSHGAAVQGFDLNSAQGYHLYLVGADGKLQRRFALYGLPQRLPHRFVPAIVRDHINSFAVGADGQWVATAGDLGLAVWSSDGKVLWQQDWYRQQRHPGKVVTLDASTLLVIEGMTATAYGATDGRKKWQQTLGRSGEIRIARVSADSKTCCAVQHRRRRQAVDPARRQNRPRHPDGRGGSQPVGRRLPGRGGDREPAETVLRDRWVAVDCPRRRSDALPAFLQRWPTGRGQRPGHSLCHRSGRSNTAGEGHAGPGRPGLAGRRQRGAGHLARQRVPAG